MKIKHIAFGLMLAAFVSSCSSKKDALSYFQNIDTETFAATYNYVDFEPKVIPGDELLITVNSTPPELTLPYNTPLINPASSEKGFLGSGTPQQSTYFVDDKGNITMPVLGKLHVEDMTVNQIAEMIVKRISNDVEDPSVSVILLNFKINVAGEVTRPGQYPVHSKRFSILDALSTAGDLTPYGDRTKVILIREENGKRTSHLLDLTKAEILESPYFYLRQNDYVYVSPNEVRIDNAKYNQNNAYKLTVISTVVSAASVIASLVIALTIK